MERNYCCKQSRFIGLTVLLTLTLSIFSQTALAEKSEPLAEGIPGRRIAGGTR
ncbi:MAG: hypothetical protein AAGF01_21295 [Cyanobacteria bacterium P01_G01_bin.38]